MQVTSEDTTNDTIAGVTIDPEGRRMNSSRSQSLPEIKLTRPATVRLFKYACLALPHLTLKISSPKSEATPQTGSKLVLDYSELDQGTTN